MTELIISLDTSERNDLIPILYRNGVKFFKLGIDAFLEPDIGCVLQTLHNRNCKVFLDLKLYDTQDSIKRIISRISQLEVEFLTVFFSKVSFAIEEVKRINSKLKIISVNELTDNPSSGTIENIKALEIADGMICSSPYAIPYYKSFNLENKIYICPGIRPNGFDSNNHFKPITPSQAKFYGADYIIIGRPIYQAKDPILVVKQIFEELKIEPV